MNRGKPKFLVLLVALVLLVQVPLAAWGCPTCGCSELCSVNMLNQGGSGELDKSLLSNSIWGRLILRMAYEHDPEIQRLLGHSNRARLGTNAMLGIAAAGTLPQTITSVDTLQQSPDSYVPGIISLPLVGITNIAIWSKFAVNAHYRKKLRERQLAIRTEVEQILHHLEFSQASCPELQKQLAEFIGPKGAEECIALWNTSHGIAAGDDSNLKAVAKNGTGGL